MGGSEQGSAGCSGFVAPGYEQVWDAFADNLRTGQETGGAFAAMVEGELVVDVCGGTTDRTGGDPWKADTMGTVFSGSKGLVATCILQLVERGELRLDDPVCRYWPEFAANSKRGVLVRHVMSHQAGLPGLRAPVNHGDITDAERMASLLAEQELFWPPGSRLCYHPLTYGWLCGEIVRRVSGLTIGAFFNSQIAQPIGLDVWIGLPADLESRVATCFLDERWEGLALDGIAADIDDRDVADIWFNPDLFPPDLPWNAPDWRAAEIPGAGAVGTARAMASHYGALASGGVYEGRQILSPTTIEIGQEPLANGIDPCEGQEFKFGVGWLLQTSQHILGPPNRAFGHSGAGGSQHGAWPDERVGFSYVTNRLRDDEDDDRAPRLLRTLYDCVAGFAWR